MRVGARPLPRGPPGGPPMPIFCYMESFNEKKNHKQAFGTRLRRHEAEPWRNQSRAQQSCSPGDTSLREGEIITNDPLIGRGSISINIFTSTISSQNPSSSLVSNLVSKPQIGTCGLLVVLITPCSWCLLVYLVEDHMFRSLMHIITPLIMNMHMLCE